MHDVSPYSFLIIRCPREIWRSTTSFDSPSQVLCNKIKIPWENKKVCESEISMMNENKFFFSWYTWCRPPEWRHLVQMEEHGISATVIPNHHHPRTHTVQKTWSRNSHERMQAAGFNINQSPSHPHYHNIQVLRSRQSFPLQSIPSIHIKTPHIPH